MDKNSQAVFGVLWDLDGVLADTGELHFQSWVMALDEIGIPLDREKFRHTFGMNNNGILSILLGHPPEPLFLARVSDRKEGLFRQMVRGKVRPLPGVRTWLERLKTMGYRQAVASSAPMENIDALVDEMQIRPYFSAIVSAFSMPGKPDPAVFLEAARQIGIPPKQCVVIEDAIPGVEAAHRAGMKCIAVTTTNPRKDLSMADIIVDSLEELNAEHFTQVPGWLR
jgi:HAD superfamily hydrolase (TIGR01509 family)